MSEKQFIDASQEAGRIFFQKYADASPLYMLNLLRFKETADFSSFDYSPEKPMSGQESYTLYVNGVRPLLKKVGAEVLYMGAASHYLIGPVAQTWDRILLVKHSSLVSFMALANDPAYQKILFYRTAGLAYSRLLPSHSL